MNCFSFLLTAATQADQSLDLLSLLLSVMLFGCAIYGLYAAIRLRMTYLLFPSRFIYPGNCKPEDCLDEDGFIDYIMPRLMLWSLLMLIVAIIYTLNAYVFLLGGLLIDIATIVIPVAVVCWLMIIQRTASKRFWSI